MLAPSALAQSLCIASQPAPFKNYPLPVLSATYYLKEYFGLASQAFILYRV
jgi:hypothetical protein